MNRKDPCSLFICSVKLSKESVSCSLIPGSHVSAFKLPEMCDFIHTKGNFLLFRGVDL